jgi:hypothetical protein
MPLMGGIIPRLQHELGGGLNHPIPDGGNAERSIARDGAGQPVGVA